MSCADVEPGFGSNQQVDDGGIVRKRISRRPVNFPVAMPKLASSIMPMNPAVDLMMKATGK